MKGTHCLEPDPPPNDTGLVVHGWDNNIIDIEDDIDYVCFRGSKFQHDFFNEKVSATCKTENIFELPESWGKCVESKI